MARQLQMLAGLLVAAVIFLLYVAISRQPTRIQTSDSQSGGAKHKDNVEGAPARDGGDGKILIKTEMYTVEARNISLKHDDVPVKVSLLAAQPKAHIAPKVPAVVLLHPVERSAKMWERMGTLQLIADMGHTAFAIDLPGTGNTRVMGRLAHSDFIQSILDYLEIERPLMVAASTAGSYAFHYAFEDSYTLSERLSGFIALSPINALAWQKEDFKQLSKIYTVLMYGGEEDLPGNEAAKMMGKVATIKLLHEPQGDHLYFLNRPDVLHDTIMKALKHLED